MRPSSAASPLFDRHRLQSLQKQVQFVHECIKAREEEARQATSERDDAVQRLAVTSQKYSQLKRSHKKLADRSLVLERQVTRCHSELSSIKGGLQEVNQECARVTQHNERLQSELRTKDRDLQQVALDLATERQRRYDEIKEGNVSLSKQNSKLMTEVRHLQGCLMKSERKFWGHPAAKEPKNRGQQEASAIEERDDHEPTVTTRDPQTESDVPAGMQELEELNKIIMNATQGTSNKHGKNLSGTPDKNGTARTESIKKGLKRSSKEPPLETKGPYNVKNIAELQQAIDQMGLALPGHLRDRAEASGSTSRTIGDKLKLKEDASIVDVARTDSAIQTDISVLQRMTHNVANQAHREA
jgi:chromosome segregation ATPase